MSHAFVIGFRCRGTDPLRRANLHFVTDYVRSLDLGPVYVVDDGRTGTAQWCRHAAYNNGARLAFNAGANIVTFYESDMILPRQQLADAITAAHTTGLVVPFSERHELNERDSELIRADTVHYSTCVGKLVLPKPRRTGAINTISRETFDAVGQYDPHFDGSHWDDRAMHRAFDICAGPTRWIDGPSHHLYHLPGYEGIHLTDEDRAATESNRRRFGMYKRATTKEQVRALTLGHA